MLSLSIKDYIDKEGKSYIKDGIYFRGLKCNRYRLPKMEVLALPLGGTGFL